MAGYRSGPRVRGRQCGFSLVELVIVVTILGIIAAIAVPRMTAAVTSASANALLATLENVRTAIDTYYAEHDRYPGYNPGDGSPSDSGFAKQLLLYTDEAGNTSPTYGAPRIYGPYLRKPFPKNPFNHLNTVKVKMKPSDADPAPGSVGWVAVLSTGYFGISATDAQMQKIGVDMLDTVNQTFFRGKATEPM